ncbi:MAG: hypothetical protein RIQ60_1929 [Pseudomonadota bacterium]|jgi:predicted ferric reductase
MTPIQLVLTGLLAGLSALWLLADSLLPQPLTYFAFRNVFVQYSGVIAIGAMSVALLLAVRPRRLEPLLRGLDKMYRLHKWLGITALSLSVAHWWLAKGTKWMVGWGWLQRPQRGPRPPAESLGLIEAWFNSQRGLAESVGEWAFYAAAALMVLALVKRFPYHLFARTHKWIAVAWLVLAWHSAVLMKFSYWSQPVGWLVGLLLLAGSVAALLVLAGRVGGGRRVQGTVEALQHYPALDVLETRVQLAPGWPGHAAGQFAFVTADRREGAHPYTIASAWQAGDAGAGAGGDTGITFITKALGDHTARLRHQLQVGSTVTVEGPYGCFDFDDGKSRQIWVGAGIGITPFVARMQQLAAEGGEPVEVDLFHPTAVHEPAAIAKLQADAQAAGIRLHLRVDAQGDDRLNGQRLRDQVPQWAQASVWFCGPAAFGAALRRDLCRHGLAAGDFHQELFELR